MLVDHACILKQLKLEATSSQILCVWQLVFWLLVVSSNYFTKFHDFTMIIQVIKLHDFSMHGTFWGFTSRFFMISRACGNPVSRTTSLWKVQIYWYLKGLPQCISLFQYSRTNRTRSKWQSPYSNFKDALASSFLEIGELAIFGYCNYSEYFMSHSLQIRKNISPKKC